MSLGVRHLGLPTGVAKLGRVVKGLYAAAYPFRVIRILTVVAIQMSHSLLDAAALLPVTYKPTNIARIHKGHMVHMAPSLSRKNHSRRHALLARTLGVWFVVIYTVVINFVGGRACKCAIRTLAARGMGFSTFFATFGKHRVKRHVLNKFTFFLVSFDYRLRHRLYFSSSSLLLLFFGLPLLVSFNLLLFLLLQLLLLNDTSHDNILVPEV